MNVIYTNTTKIYLQELVKTLYEKEYFGSEEYAARYVNSLTENMEATIHLKMKRKAPSYFSRYGKNLWYVSYPRSKQTTWYFFFNKYANNTYVIRYITNNHVEGHFIK